MLVMWHSTRSHIVQYDMWIAFILFSFFNQHIHKHAHYIMKSDIPILKYVQVNVFGSLNTFIITVLVDLYHLMGATMLVCAES